MESHEEVAHFGRHENLTASELCHAISLCIGQIIEHPCSACSCVYYWCNWKPSQKEDEKKKKKESKSEKTTRFSFGLQHLGHFISEQVGICLRLVCIDTSSEIHLLFIQALGPGKAKGLCKPHLGFLHLHLDIFCTSFPCRQPTQLERGQKGFLCQRVGTIKCVTLSWTVIFPKVGMGRALTTYCWKETTGITSVSAKLSKTKQLRS